MKNEKINSAIWKISISQIKKLLNILGVQMISKKLKIEFEHEIIESLIFRYFNIRNFEIS